jgi:hypothetical protein
MWTDEIVSDTTGLTVAPPDVFRALLIARGTSAAIKQKPTCRRLHPFGKTA